MTQTSAPPGATLIHVIRTELEVRGSGTRDDPHRRVIQFWSTDGELLAEADPRAPTHCNAVGHLVHDGDAGCRRCGASLEYMLGSVLRGSAAPQENKASPCFVAHRSEARAMGDDR